MTIKYTLDNTIENSAMATVVFPHISLPGAESPATPSLGVELYPYQLLTPSVGARETFSYEGKLAFQATILAKKAGEEEDTEEKGGGQKGILPIKPSVSSPVTPVNQGEIFQLQALPGKILVAKTGSTSEPQVTVENPPVGNLPPLPVSVTWLLDSVPFCTMSPIAGPKFAILTLQDGLLFMAVSSLKIPASFSPATVLKNATLYIPPLSTLDVTALFQTKARGTALDQVMENEPSDIAEETKGETETTGLETPNIPELPSDTPPSEGQDPSAPISITPDGEERDVPVDATAPSPKVEYVFNPLSAKPTADFSAEH